LIDLQHCCKIQQCCNLRKPLVPPKHAEWLSGVRIPNGLAEITVNLGRADRDLGLTNGSPVEIIPLKEDGLVAG